jgi:hypothetical protein
MASSKRRKRDRHMNRRYHRSGSGASAEWFSLLQEDPSQHRPSDEPMAYFIEASDELCGRRNCEGDRCVGSSDNLLAQDREVLALRRWPPDEPTHHRSKHWMNDVSRYVAAMWRGRTPDEPMVALVEASDELCQQEFVSWGWKATASSIGWTDA